MSPMGEAGEPERKLKKEMAQMPWSAPGKGGLREEHQAGKGEQGSRAGSTGWEAKHLSSVCSATSCLTTRP